MTNKLADNKAIDIVILLVRLFIGWRFLSILFQLIHFIDTSNTFQLIGIFVTLIGGILLVIGLFVRQASGVVILWFIILALAGYGFSAINTNFVNIVILLIILLLGPGKYSLDYLRSKK